MMGSLVDCKKEESVLAFFSVVAISANLSTKIIGVKVKQTFRNMQVEVPDTRYQVSGAGCQVAGVRFRKRHNDILT
jgi:hypothetical protein